LSTEASTAEAAAPSGGLRRAGSGVKWKLVGSIAERLLNIVSLAIMARMVAKGDFGLVAIANVAYSLVGMLRDLGVQEAIIRSRDATPAFINTCFWVRLSVGVFLYAVLGFIAIPFAWFFNRDILVPMLMTLGTAYILDALPTIQEALLVRDFRMKQVAFTRVASVIFGVLIGWWAAFAGWGAWALIANVLATTASAAVFLFPLVSWRPAVMLDRDRVGHLLHFGGNLTATQFLGWFTESFSTAVLARIVPNSEVGIFRIAYVVGKWPDSLLGSVLGGGMAVSSFAKIEHQVDRMRDGLVKVTSVIYLAGLGVTVVILMLANPLVLSIYGPQWADVASVAPWIALGGAALMMRQTLRHWLIASGLSAVLTKNQIRTAIVSILLTIFGAWYGLMGITITSTLACIFEAVMLWYSNVERTGLDLRGWIRAFWRPFAVNLGVCVALFPVNIWLAPGLWPIVHLGLGLAVAGIAWILGAILLMPADIEFFTSTMFGKKRGVPETQTAPAEVLDQG
jgi:O-antigen/teichoic acid export membrane protein